MAIEESRGSFSGCFKNIFASFPKETCGHCSILLGLYLQEIGCLEVQYVCGEREFGRRKSHAWLEIGNVIVDITADQFPERAEPVVVTQDRTWHGKFHCLQRKPLLRHFCSRTAESKENYNNAYALIKTRLPQSLLPTSAPVNYSD